ncbi:MAG: hypothetical protein WAU69_05915 [Solirubrobacteraceae bacterium]
MKAAHLDATQFADRRTYPVSAHKTAEGWFSTGLDFADYSRMGTQQRKPSGERRLPTPQWAVNDLMLRELLVSFMEERAGVRKKRGELLERLARAQKMIINQRPRLSAILDKLCRDYVHIKRFGAYADLSDTEVLDIAEAVFINRPLLASDPSGLGARQMLTAKQARDWQIEIEGLDSLLRYSNGPSAGAGTIAAVAFLYYRVGYDSVGVGMELGIKPPHVRQLLYRLHETAAKLWPAEKAVCVIIKEEEGRPLFAEAS